MGDIGDKNNYIYGNHDSVIILLKSDHLPTFVDVSVGNKKISGSSDSDDVTWKIWEQLYRCRELEIKTQWQRSVFLSAFIVILLTGTGFFLFQTEFKSSELDMGSNVCIWGFILGLLTMVAAVFWLALTKGSKYWTEIYEAKIDLIEAQIPFFKDNAQFKYREEKNIKELDSQKSQLVGCNEFSLGPDHTSPSKVNIAIGWLLLIIGIWLSIYYFGKLCTFIVKNCCCFHCNIEIFLLFSILGPIFVFVLLRYLYLGLKHEINSCVGKGEEK